jgi:hypothetical protein
VLARHIHELQAGRVTEGLGDLCHAERVIALHVGIDNRLATALAGGALLPC